MDKYNLLIDLYQKGRLYLGLLKAQKTKKPVPLIVNLFVTGKCDARCKYCYVEIEKIPEREFSLNEWKNLIDDLYDKGTRFFALVGGEPLIYPHIDELIKYIASKKVFLNLATNAFTIEKHLDTAKMASEVSISLDGDQTSHNKNRGKLNYELSVRGIDAAVKAGIKVRLCTVVTKHNLDQIDFLTDFAEKRNLFISFTPLIDAPNVRKEEAEALRLSNKGIREFFIKLKEAKKRSSRIINSYENMDYMINYPIRYGEIIWRNSPHSNYYTQPCPYGRFQYLINNVGEVYPCAIMWNNSNYFRPKNIFAVGLEEALDNASNTLRCQCCSFGNAADWNSVSSLPWLWYGLKMTLKQALGGPIH